jgi:UDP-N-acetylmuramoyl-L-alanyl-D-glutamate--2,6-diaminopimelate ligase
VWLRDLASEVTGSEYLPSADGHDVAVDDVVHDSRNAGPGSLFCCIPGVTTDGHDHAPDAVARGAVALVVDRILDLDVPQIRVADARVAMAEASAACFGHPDRTLAVIGVTGTNGKTTTTWMLNNVFEEAGRRVEVLGTLSGERTTPESPDLQRRLGRWRDDGVEVVAMEVSSHAIALHRVDAMRFRVAVFTNLSRDHLDFHGSMEEYFAVKAELFEPTRCEQAVVNLDSPHGRLLVDVSAVPIDGFSLDEAVDLRLSVDGSSFTWRGHPVSLSIGGAFNVSNALAAAHAASAVGLDDATIAAGLSRPIVVEGRFERVEAGQPCTVIVDFAHTPDGLEQLLLAAGDLVTDDGRVIVVFGCGGDRDASKRPAMGEVAVRRADVAVVTADNSRSESTDAIISAIRAGIDRTVGRRASEVVIEPDRRRAISTALGLARSGDIVLIAGKGHETTQISGDEVSPFDDRVVVAEEWRRLEEAT